MSLDKRIESLFRESVGMVDDYLRTLVSGLNYPSLCLRECGNEFDDFLVKYDSLLRRCSRKTRKLVLERISEERQNILARPYEQEAFVFLGLPEIVYYTPVLFEMNSTDVHFKYAFCHETIHARHLANYSLYRQSDPDKLLLSFILETGEGDSAERDECLVDCTMSKWFAVEDNVLAPLVRKRGLDYVWRLALDHTKWERDDFASAYL